jgi:hypothetical protein
LKTLRQGTGVKPRATAKLQHLGTRWWFSSRPKRTNYPAGIITKNLFATKNVNPGETLEEAVWFLDNCDRAWLVDCNCCTGGKNRFGGVIHLVIQRFVHRLSVIFICHSNKIFTFMSPITWRSRP